MTSSGRNSFGRARFASALFALSIAGVASAATPAASVAAKKDAPSRAASKGCAWRKMSDATVGLEAWVERCDYGFRKIDFEFVGHSLAIRYSDGGSKPDPLVDVIPLLPNETIEAGIRREYAAHTEKSIADRCMLAPYVGEGSDKPPKGVKRYTFVPNASYKKELDAAVHDEEDDVGDPLCGDWGDAPDGIQYFQAWPESKARAVLFVRIGQDEPLFDEKTLKLIEPTDAAVAK